jgi:predicted component of type VI protein secretion system
MRPTPFELKLAMAILADSSSHLDRNVENVTNRRFLSFRQTLAN